MRKPDFTIETILCRDDGVFPNSVYPVLLYRGAFAGSTPEEIEKKLDDHGWCNSWRNGIMDCDHYHSNTHEVLVVYAGEVTVLFGGPNGSEATAVQGDAIVVPAGVSHNNRHASENFNCIGAYPNGTAYDMNYGKAGERPAADNQIRVVPFPHNDPVTGDSDSLRNYWRSD